MNVLIIEDEILAANRLVRILEKNFTGVKVLGQLESLEESVAFFSGEHVKPDLIFMDIHLADGNSLNLFNLVTINSPVIFITAYDEYTLKAFKQLTVDYLLKPVKEEELVVAIRKYERHFKEEPSDYRKIFSEMAPSMRHMIKIGNKLIVVEPNEVAYYYTHNRINYLMTFDGNHYPVDDTLDQIEQKFCTGLYFRINRQYIVHFNSIKQMKRTTKSRVQIWLQPEAPGETIVSTERSPAFKEWLTGMKK